MKIILVRHGETLFNALDLTQGWCDSPLTERGKKQAKSLSQKLVGFDIDEAYSSTSERAYDTAEIVLGDREIEIRRDRRLKEMNFGVFEGNPNRLRPMVMHADEAEDERRNGFTGKPDFSKVEGYGRYGGEEVSDMLARELSFLKDHVSEEEKTILIAGHGLSLSGLIHYLAEPDVEAKFPHFFMMKNASAAILEYKAGAYSLLDLIEAEEER